jgi:D-arabinose 1-dehydrogenase-like Zn-dependent alcohol dehydrogenase
VTFPCTAGHGPPAGEIVELGDDVTTRKKGDRVGVPYLQSSCGRCEWCQRGKRLFCEKQQGTGVQLQGGFAEYMLANADATMLIPNEITYDQAAPIFCAGYTVWSGLRAEPNGGKAVVNALQFKAMTGHSLSRIETNSLESAEKYLSNQGLITSSSVDPS